MTKNVHWSSCKVPVIFALFEWNLKFLDRFSKKYSNIEFRENLASGRRVVPCGRTDRQTYMKKLIFAFRYFANAKWLSSYGESEDRTAARSYTHHLRTLTDIIIIIIIISFIQGIYTYIRETNYVHREYSFAAILLLLFMVFISLVSELNLLYLYISTFRSMCAVPNMAVFCSSLTSCFPGMLLTYFLNDFEIVLVAPIITGISFVFTFHMHCIIIIIIIIIIIVINCNWVFTRWQ